MVTYWHDDICIIIKSERRESMFGRLMNSIQQFMYGRYGNDKLNVALLIAWMMCAFVNIFLKSPILYAVGIGFAILCFLRMFSKNTYKRSNENAKFEKVFHAVKVKFNLQILKIKQRNTHRFFKCPACRATIRVPKRVGKMDVRCTKCGHRFEKTIRF